MTCDKCGSAINSGTKCFNCGYDNKNVRMPSQKFLNKALSSPSAYRSMRLTVFMFLFIALNIVLILLSARIFFNDEIQQGGKILAGISAGLMAADTILCIFILRLKKWAFNLYIGLNIINCVLRLIAYFDIFTVIFRGLLLYFIFRNDVEYFE